MHVLVHQEHDRSPRPKSHDLWHYAFVEREEPGTVNHPPPLPSHLPFLPVHSGNHPCSTPVNLLPHWLGTLQGNHTCKGLSDIKTARKDLNPRLGNVKGNVDTAAKGASGQTNSNLGGGARKIFSASSSPCARTQACSLGSLAPSSSPCDRNQNTPAMASVDSNKPFFTMLKYPFLAIVPVMPFPSSPFRPNPSSLTISLATLLKTPDIQMKNPPSLTMLMVSWTGVLG